MSLSTRCPACATLFRVVPDQLKISEGWVRCGQCSQVFDARLSLQPLPPAGQEPLQPQAGTDSPPPAVAPPLPSAAAPATTPEASPEALPEAAPESLPESPAAPLPGEPPEPVLAPGPLAGDVLSDQGAESAVEPGAASAPASAATGVAAAASAAAATGAEPSFQRQARRRAYWQRRGVRITLALLALGLALLLSAQLAYHHRDRLATEVPALQPALAAACEALGCRLGPPRRIEAIAIESSSFTRLRPDAFQLNFTLSNAADIALALPALEITLTDLQDQPVLRRVVLPADLGPDAPVALGPRAGWSSTLTLAVASGVNASRIVGYRVLAFYP